VALEVNRSHQADGFGPVTLISSTGSDPVCAVNLCKVLIFSK